MLQKDILLPSEIKVVSEDEKKGVYEIGDLYPGYGHTLGNSIRRVILSSTPGWAVTKIKIEGIPHEFTAIEDVKEDAINIVLNLKKLVFKVDDELFPDGVINLKLSKKGKGEVFGKDIETPTGVEVVNGDEYLFTISAPKRELNIDFNIQRGTGFVSKEALIKGEKLEVGEIVLDTGFAPVKKVGYEVLNTRVGNRTDYNKLIITIETDGSLKPKEVLVNALEILIRQLKAILNISETSLKEEETNPLAQSDETIAVLDLDENLLGKLASSGIIKISDLVAKTDLELLNIEGVDEETLNDIKKALEKLNK